MVSGMILEKKYGVHCDKVVILRSLPKAKEIELLEQPAWAKKREYKDVIYSSLKLN
jgi:hypothetical protein